jgi:hypothetical protein
MLERLPIVIALLFAPLAPAIAAQPALPEEIVLTGDNIIEVLLNGAPVRLEVSAEAFGPPIINPELAERLLLVSQYRRGWRFGPVGVMGVGGPQVIDFGAGPVPITVTWADRPASTNADGVIGVHHLPHASVTFAFAPTGQPEIIQRFVLRRTGGNSNTRLGTEVTVGKRQLMMIFALERAENLITAPTANFIATHQEGGFVPGSDDIAEMAFGVERPTRTMRIAQAIDLGDLVIDQFAVRVEDYGDPSRVGEVGENDPRFEKGQILVSRRKGRGKPDLLTRIGRDQIAHCSQLTYVLEQQEIRLSCAELAD